MNTPENQYIQALRNACQEIKLDYFPQVEASELLYKVITLEDIYLPLTLEPEPLSRQSGNSRRGDDIDMLIDRIDKKIAELEARVAEESNASELDDLEDLFAEEAAEGIQDTGLRLTLKAKPGSGKTTFCKRLALALIEQDDAFGGKYAAENGLQFRPGSFPVLLNCKNIMDLTTAALQASTFSGLIYRLCSLGMGNHFAGISEDAFSKLLQAKAEAGLTLIVDGWDEILDAQKEEVFRYQLDAFLTAFPQTDLVLTLRPSYIAPSFAQPYSHQYQIKPLSDQDTREFCRKWCQSVLSPSSQKKYDHSQIAERIIRSADPQIRLLRKNPLDLSLLLIVSKNDGKLPDNKAELFKELVELYIFWSTTKNSSLLSAKSIRIFLAYIACYFTKYGKLHCGYEELVRIITQCIHDLEWSFSQDVTQFSVHDILQELSRSNILTLTFDGQRYSFSETTSGSHRQMQEYLTAYAISAQYADEEYNNLSPIAIFADKYGKRQWHEIVVFLALMGNGRLRQEIVKQLILKAQTEENDYPYTNLLFELVVNGAEIRLADRHAIYDLLFAEHITDRQITDIHHLVVSEGRVAEEFIRYIDERFAASVEAGKIEYCYAKAVIASAQALQQGRSPFDLASKYLAVENHEKVLTGIFVILVQAWCKYNNIAGVFRPYYARYHMSPELICTLSQLLDRGFYKTELLRTLRHAILANFATFGDFFCMENMGEYYTQIVQNEAPIHAEIVLSLVPVFDPDFRPCSTIPTEIKSKYSNRFKEEHAGRKYQELIFTFSICAALGCWEEAEKEAVWTAMDTLYSGSDIQMDSMEKARFNQLKTSRNRAQAQKQAAQVWIQTEKTEQYFVYQKDNQTLRIRYGTNPLTADAADFLKSTITDTHIARNNLAYLLRRREIDGVERIIGGETVALTPADLLEKGRKVWEPFSLVNHALAMCEIHRDTVAKAELGELSLSLPLLSPYVKTNGAWEHVISWWLTLACEREELEGLVVISWLFNRELFHPISCPTSVLQALLKLANKAESMGLHIQNALIAAIQQVLDSRAS